MVHWHLPESIHVYGPIAKTHVRGMIRAMADRKAPGGFHMSTEGTYTNTSPKSIVSYYASIVNSVNELLGDELMPYWNERCSINPGLWPLGYYKDVLDDDGNRIGYTGKDEKFHGAVVGSYADKSNNYSVEEFRNQFGTVTAFGAPYFWIYCHGQVLWQMTEEEMARFHGTRSDTLPVDDNLEAYINVMREARPILNPDILEAVERAKAGERPKYVGFPPAWKVTGVYPCTDAEAYRTAYEPEMNPDSPSLIWQTVRPDGQGLVGLREHTGEHGLVLAYGMAEFDLDEDMQVVFRFGSNDWGTVFFDGREVFEFVDHEGRGARVDQDCFVMNLTKGRHMVLIKCGDLGGSAWEYLFRITDMNGNAVDGLRWLEQ